MADSDTSQHQLVIDHASGGALVARQTSASNRGLFVVLFVLALVAMGFSLRLRQSGAVILTGLFCIAAGIGMYMGGEEVAQMTVNPAANQIAWTLEAHGKVGESKTAALTDFATVNLDKSPAGMRLVLTTPDGTNVYPLTDSMLRNEPRQYLLLDAMRQYVGHTAPAGTPAANGTPQ